jgi:hypothetical protein
MTSMDIQPALLRTFSSQRSYYVVAGGNRVGVGLVATDDLVELVSFDDLDAIPPGGEYPRSPGWSCLHQLRPGATVEDLAIKHGLELQPTEPLQRGQAPAAYGTSPEQAMGTWRSQAARDGIAPLDAHEFQVEKVATSAGRPAVWRAAAYVV